MFCYVGLNGNCAGRACRIRRLFQQFLQVYPQRLGNPDADVDGRDDALAFYIIQMAVRDSDLQRQVQQRNLPVEPFRADVLQDFHGLAFHFACL